MFYDRSTSPTEFLVESHIVV